MSTVGVLHVAKFSRDVEVVKKYAKCCVYITDDGVEVEENPDFRIEMLAVIGPYEDDTLSLPQAVLLEVGLKRAKPYSEATGVKDGNPMFPKYYPDRHGHLRMTAEQYQLVAPVIFEYLARYAQDRVMNWKHDWRDPRWVKVEVGEHKHFGITRNFKWYPQEPAIRFTISKNDQFIVSDIFWAEIFGQYNFEFRIQRLMSYMGWRLGGFKTRGRKHWPKDWMIYRRFAEAITALKKLPWYLQVHVWKTHFPPHYPFHYEIMEQIKYEGVDPWEEVMRNAVLPNPEQRMGNIALRVVRQDAKYLVFEIFPPQPAEEDIIPF